MIREKITDPWREVSLGRGDRLRRQPRSRRIQAKYGRGSIGGITSSRCTNEETFLVQKLIRAGFGNNNVDTCARVCHSPTGYGLTTTFGTSAGTQDFNSVEQADVIMVIGANPTDGHPVFASRMKKRLREGAKLIVIDPRRIESCKSPHIEAAHHLPLQPGTNVAVVTALAHVIVTEGLVDEAFIARALRLGRIRALGRASSPTSAIRRRRCERITGVPAADVRAAARLYATGGNGAIYYGLGVTEHSQGSTTVMAHRQPRHGDRQHRPRRRRREPAARPEQRAGLLRHGLLPARVPGLPPRLATTPTRDMFESAVGRDARRRAGPAHPQHARRRRRGHVQGPLHPGRGHRSSPTPTPARGGGPRRRWNASSCRTCS